MTFDIEVGFSTAATIVSSGRIVASEVAGSVVARTTYRGLYHQLYEAWREFGTWVATQGHAPAPHLWEVYLVGPESSGDRCNG